MDRASVFPPASTRPRAGAARALALAALTVSACSLSQNGVDPPADTFFYPTSAVMSPDDTDGQWLYVANSNADLRFNDGTLVMVNVGMHTDVGTQSGAAFDRTQAWGQCPQADYVNPLPRGDAPICCRDLLDSNVINCDERRYVASDATVRIGSFAALMVWQRYCDDPCNPNCQATADAGRLLIGVRGDTSLTYVDVAPVGPAYQNPTAHPEFHCTEGDGLATSLTECTLKITDTASVLDVFNGDNEVPEIDLPDEPYALALDDPRGFLYVGHLVGSTSVQDTGGVSLFDASGTGAVAPPSFPLGPKLIAPFPSPFGPNNSGLFGVTALEMHEPLGASPGSDREIFVSSRYVPLVTSMIPLGPSVCGGDDNDDVVLPAGDSLNSALVGSEMRGVEFIDPSPSVSSANDPLDYAQRAYALQRMPPDLVGFDIAKNEAGATAATPTDVSETCSSPTFLYQYPPAALATTQNPSRLFVNCFDTGEVYIFDPNGPTLLSTLQVGRGPAGMVFDATRPVGYVLDFTQNIVSVVDLTPGSATQYHVIQRLGFPTVTPR
jgi:DNA-binding beta-propeller fold protein YncE